MPELFGTPVVASALRWVTFIVVEANVAFLLVYDQVRELPSLGDQASQYATPFQPAGFVHWIYWIIGAAVFGFYVAALAPQEKRTPQFDPFVVPLAVAGLLASAWAVAFRNDAIGLALAFTAGGVVVGGAMFVRAARTVSRHARALRIPFALYFGWMSFALLVNVAQWLNARGSLPTLEVVTALSLLLLVLAALVGIAVAARYREFIYPVVLAWGATGIYAAQRVFEPLVAYVALGCAAVLAFAAAAALVAAALEAPEAAFAQATERGAVAPRRAPLALASVLSHLRWRPRRPTPPPATEPGAQRRLADLDSANTGVHSP